MRITTHAKLFIELALAFSVCSAVAEEWKVDLSRRLPEVKKDDMRAPASDGNVDAAPSNLIDAVFQTSDPAQEIVVLNTDKGFIPSQLRVRQGQTYKIYLVNVNESEKNVSFVLDAFSE